MFALFEVRLEAKMPIGVLLFHYLSSTAALAFFKYLHYMGPRLSLLSWAIAAAGEWELVYGCLTKGICKLVGRFSGLSNARPSTFLLPLNNMSL
jgi:hypothetical protein